MPDYHVGDLLIHTDVPVLPSEDTLTVDWAQIELYDGPLWDRTFVETTRRTSLWTTRAGLLLFDRHQIGELPDLLRFLGVGNDRGYAVRVADSDDPLHDGYLTALRFTAAASDSQPHGLAEVMLAFVTAEAKRHADIEGAMRRRYGEMPDELLQEDPVFHYTDYPAFDSGKLAVGFGLLLEYGASRLWSRPVHYHK